MRWHAPSHSTPTALALALALAPALLPAQDIDEVREPRPAASDKNALQVISNYYTAQGGQERLATASTYAALFREDIGGNRIEAMTFADFNTDSFLEVSVQRVLGRDVSNVEGFNGETLWRLDLGERDPRFSRVAGLERELTVYEGRISSPLLRFDYEGYRYTFVGKIKVRAREAFEIQVHPPSGIPAYVAFDAETFLPVRVSYKTVIANTLVDVDVYHRKLRREAGFWVPGNSEIQITGNTVKERELVNLRVGVPLEPIIFEPVATRGGWRETLARLPFGNTGQP